MNFTAMFGTRQQLSPNLHGVFTWYFTLSSYSKKNYFWKFCFNGSLNVFVTLPMMTSNLYQIWQFQGPRSRDFSIGYRNIWIRREGLQRSTFSLEIQIIMIVMTYTATRFDYKFIIFKPFK